MAKQMEASYMQNTSKQVPGDKIIKVYDMTYNLAVSQSRKVTVNFEINPYKMKKNRAFNGYGA